MTDLHIDSNTKLKEEAKIAPEVLRKQKLDQEDKETQEVLAAGQDDITKAIPEIKSQVKEEQQDAKRAEDEILNRLDSKRRFADSYRNELARSLAEILGRLDWLRGWSADCVVTSGQPITIKGRGFQTQKGLLLIVCAPDGRVMHQGMKITGEPMLDYAGVYTMALQAENTMDYERGLLLTGTGGKDFAKILDKNGRPLSN